MIEAGLRPLAREADLWRELADVRGKLRSAPTLTRHLKAREDLLERLLRQLGVTWQSHKAVERFDRYMLLSRDEARSIRALITRKDTDSDAHVLGALLGRIIVALDGPPPIEDEPETSPA